MLTALSCEVFKQLLKHAGRLHKCVKCIASLISLQTECAINHDTCTGLAFNPRRVVRAK